MSNANDGVNAPSKGSKAAATEALLRDYISWLARHWDAAVGPRAKFADEEDRMSKLALMAAASEERIKVLELIESMKKKLKWDE